MLGEMGYTANSNPLLSMGFSLTLCGQNTRSIFMKRLNGNNDLNSKMHKGFELFMQNPYWKEYYDNAPSEKLKKFIAFGFDNNEDYTGSLNAEHKKMESELSIEDFKYLIQHAGIVQAKIYYHGKIKELMENKTISPYVIFHAPHEGNCFPTELMDSVIVHHSEFFSYHNKMSDTGVLQFIPKYEPSETVAFGISRLLCDVERFTDGTEVMEKFGMGYCYEKAYDGTTIKSISDELKNMTYKYYFAHHKKLDEIVEQHPQGVLMFDIHSFSKEIIVNEEVSMRIKMPDICLGYDRSFCSQELIDVAKSCFEAFGFYVEENYPYSGSLIPNIVLKGKTKTFCESIMLEINKEIYLKNNEVDEAVASKIRNAISRIIDLYKPQQSKVGYNNDYSLHLLF